MRTRRRIVLVLLVALPLLLVGALWGHHRWMTSQREEVYEAVFRHQIQVLDAQLSPRPAR